MNIKSLTLAIIAVSATMAATSQASLADGGSGARWDYTPNTWKDSGPTKHGRYLNPPEPVGVVRAGSMPGGNMLGLNPSLLSKPPAPAIVHTFANTLAQPVVAAKMTSAAPTGQVRPSIPPAFKAAFGDPLKTFAPPIVAALPQSAQPQAGQPAAPKKPSATSASTNTHIAWHSPHHKPGASGSANALPPTLGYGGRQNNFYQPGSFAPAVSSSSSASTNTAVSGVIVHGGRAHY